MGDEPRPSSSAAGLPARGATDAAEPVTPPWPIDHLFEGFIAVDAHWRITQINESAARYFQLSRSQMLGRVLWDALPTLKGTFHAACLQRVMRDRAPSESEVVSSLWPERWVKMRIEPDAEAGGGLWALFMETTPRHAARLPLVAIDVSPEDAERRPMAQALRETQERFRLMAETIPDILFSNESDGSNEYANARFYEYTGFAPGAALGFGWLQAFHPDDRQIAIETWRQVTRTGERWELECRLRRHDGEYRWFRGRAQPLRDESGRITRWFGVGTDIHAEKVAREQLEQAAERAEAQVAQRTAQLASRATQLRALALKLTHAEESERSRIAQVLHDDVQQLLAAAQMKLARVSHDGGATPDIADAQDLIARTIAVARSLVIDLVPPSLQHGDFIAALRWLVERKRERYGLAVTLEAPGEVELDARVRAMVFRALQELLFNVVKHAGVKQAVVRLEPAEGMVRLSVEDRGVGMELPPRETAATPQGAAPTGLGLFGIRERIEAIGGAMEVQPVQGGGTRVILTIPSAAGRSTG